MTTPSLESASPRSVLPFHIIGIAALGTGQALLYFVPFLVRQRFAASEAQTLVFTATVPVMMSFTVFWNHLYVRIRPRTYLLVMALLIVPAVVLMGLATNIWVFMAGYVVAALGGACGGSALAPLNADLLRACYSEANRGRVFGFVSVAQYGAIMICVQTMGWWSDRDINGYRIFLPCLAVCLFVGLAAYHRITVNPLFEKRERLAVVAGRSLLGPIRDMARILYNDRRFAAYELAFMVYGFAYMICTALLPIMGTEKLNLNNTQYAFLTVTLFQFTFMLVLFPSGWLTDRVGAMRHAAVSFIWLTAYPIGLIWCPNAYWLGVMTVFYALGLVGVYMTWTLGPVSLAPNPSQAPHYLAIHSTLVGVRGVVAQGLGVFLYVVCGGFEVPFTLAALLFLVAGLGMLRLARRCQSQGG